ncbi:hypothetical protein HDE_05363 [Halotydeus destructor]|nr:hypothetical protein HDE_05363 [Halotydeus destructor]
MASILTCTKFVIICLMLAHVIFNATFTPYLITDIQDGEDTVVSVPVCRVIVAVMCDIVFKSMILVSIIKNSSFATLTWAILLTIITFGFLVMSPTYSDAQRISCGFSSSTAMLLYFLTYLIERDNSRYSRLKTVVIELPEPRKY